MTLTIDLTPEEEARLQVLAQREGIDLARYARQRLGLAMPSAENQAVIDLLHRWRDEDAHMTQQEAEAAENEWNELRSNMNERRVLSGEEPLF